MTPWLSERMVKCVLWCPCEMTRRRPNSMAINSAQPILRPPDFQPLRSCIASQRLSKTIPIPQSVEASTQNSMGDGGGGWERMDPQMSFLSCSRHHVTSLRTALGGVFRTKSERAPVKEAEKREIDGRRDRPSGTASEQCTRVPRMDSVSLRVNLLSPSHGFSFSRYLVFFLVVI
jgi:hypothetical protein